jgi:hypothetical protein
MGHAAVHLPHSKQYLNFSESIIDRRRPFACMAFLGFKRFMPLVPPL